MLSRFSQLTQSLSEELLQGPKEPKSDPLSVIERSSKLLKTVTPDISDVLIGDEAPADSNGVAKKDHTPPVNGKLANASSDPGSQLSSGVQSGAPSAVPSGVPSRNSPLQSNADDSPRDSPATSAGGKEMSLEQKLAKFAKYEDKYPQLLRAYRIEKKKNELVQLFEKVLSEATPCTSIGEPQQMLNYLNGLTSKNELLKEELEKVTAALRAAQDPESTRSALAKARAEGIEEGKSIERDEALKNPPKPSVDNAALEEQLANLKKTMEEDAAKKAAEIAAEHKKTVQKLRKDLKKAKKRAGAAGDTNGEDEQDDADEKAEEIRAELEAEAIQLKDEIKSLGSKIQDLNSTIDHQKAQITELEQKTSSQDEQSLKLRTENKTLSTELEQLKKKETVKTQQLTELQKTVNQLRDSSTSQESDLRRELADAKRKLGVVEGQENKLGEDCRKLKSERVELQNQLQQLKQQLQNSNTTHEAAKKAQSLLKTQLSEIGMRLSEATASTDILRDEASEAARIAQERQQELARLRNQLHSRDSNRNSAVSDAQSQISLLTSEREQLESEIEVMSKRLVRETENLHSQIRTLRDQLAESDASVATYRKEIESLRRATRHSNLVIQQKDSSRPEKLGSSSTSTRHLEAESEEVLKLRKSLEESKSMLKNAEKANELLKKVNEDSTLRVEKLQKAQRALSEDLDQLRQENMRMKDRQRRGTMTSGTPSEPVPASIDEQSEKQRAYVKNVLLGFLEHKEQRHQLLPVIATLLNFEGNDQQRFWTAFANQ